jgi:hypothetical protein
LLFICDFAWVSRAFGATLCFFRAFLSAPFLVLFSHVSAFSLFSPALHASLLCPLLRFFFCVVSFLLLFSVVLLFSSFPHRRTVVFPAPLSPCLCVSHASLRVFSAPFPRPAHLVLRFLHASFPRLFACFRRLLLCPLLLFFMFGCPGHPVLSLSQFGAPFGRCLATSWLPTGPFLGPFGAISGPSRGLPHLEHLLSNL